MSKLPRKRKPKPPINPTLLIGEILGEKAYLGQNPKLASFECPYIKRECTKRGQKGEATEPYPICSIWRGGPKHGDAETDLIIVCPNRLRETDFFKEVVDRCWPGDKPQIIKIASEVAMKGFGNVDFVIAEVSSDKDIKQFISVELQSVDITGSVRKAYDAIKEGLLLEKRPNSSFNWDNVYKRYVTQLIRKGYFHHHWNTKIVSVIPDQVYEYIINKAGFVTTGDVSDPQVNVIFMTYVLREESDGQFKPILKKVRGAGHSAIQAAIMYKSAPSISDFKLRILGALRR